MEGQCFLSEKVAKHNFWVYRMLWNKHHLLRGRKHWNFWQTFDPWWTSVARSMKILLCFLTLSSTLVDLKDCPLMSRSTREDVESGFILMHPCSGRLCVGVIGEFSTSPLPAGGVLKQRHSSWQIVSSLWQSFSKVALTIVFAKNLHNCVQAHCIWALVGSLSLIPAINVRCKPQQK